MEAVEEIPIKIKKPRSEKQIEAFAKALAKKAELSLINKEFNETKKKQNEDVVEHKKQIIEAAKEPKQEVEVEVEVEPEVEKPKLKKKTKKLIPPPVQSESEEEEEIIVKRKAKPKKKPVKKIIYEDTSSEESEEDDDKAIVNMAKLIIKNIT